MENIFDLIPKDKSDDSNINKLKEINIKEIKPILGGLLEWIQDLNWPIAKKLIKILPRFHVELIPHIKNVLESNDDEWKNCVLFLLRNFPYDSVKLLSPYIIRIANYPTKSELEEGTNEYAIDVIKKFNIEIY
jgi:hypothetical protein